MEDQKFDGGPAFPIYDHYSDGQQFLSVPGMTMRDYFAAKALQGLASQPGCPTYEYEAMAAYKYADAMLKARNA